MCSEIKWGGLFSLLNLFHNKLGLFNQGISSFCTSTEPLPQNQQQQMLTPAYCCINCLSSIVIVMIVLCYSDLSWLPSRSCCYFPSIVIVCLNSLYVYLDARFRKLPRGGFKHVECLCGTPGIVSLLKTWFFQLCIKASTVFWSNSMDTFNGLIVLRIHFEEIK